MRGEMTSGTPRYLLRLKVDPVIRDALLGSSFTPIEDH